MSGPSPAQNNAIENGNGRWLPLMEYAMSKGVSLSTLRRYIKANKIQFRIENGRYLILDAAATPGEAARPAHREAAPAKAAANDTAPELRRALEKAQEEIAELKMLVALYEERMPHARLDV